MIYTYNDNMDNLYIQHQDRLIVMSTTIFNINVDVLKYIIGNFTFILYFIGFFFLLLLCTIYNFKLNIFFFTIQYIYLFNEKPCDRILKPRKISIRILKYSK